ncbi:MAG: response regulator [Bdellovibrio sp.]|nr:response regulator [Bdellovibrio sp.]
MARILVADDSLTIQKVVSITLSSLPHQLVPAKSESELNTLLKTDKFDLILLDFGLVDKKSGYDLAREVRKSGYNGPILTLVGTFDSIDENNLRDAKIEDYITKPFESEKFISKCQNLLSQSSSESTSSSPFELNSIADLDAKTEIDLKEATNQLSENDDANWVMNASHETSGVREIDLSQLDDDLASADVNVSQKNKLQEDLSGWGIGIPDVIGKVEETSLVPPKLPERRPMLQALDPGDDEFEDVDANKSQNTTDVFHIEDFLSSGPEQTETAQVVNLTRPPETVKDISNSSKDDDFKLPDAADLEYPSFTFETEKPKSKLIPLDQLSPIAEEDSDITDPAFELPQGLNEKLLAQFQADEDPDKFWAADSTPIPGKEQVKTQVSTNEKVGIKFDENWEFRSNQVNTPTGPTPVSTQTVSSLNEDAIVQKILAKLAPLLESKLKDYCKNSVERIAWEVIPDLAENLIREEIKKIEAQSRT